jgi:hypothetical protein
MLWRFLDGAYERFPGLAETKTSLSVHNVWMELNLNGFPNNTICVSGFSGEDISKYHEIECGVLSCCVQLWLTCLDVLVRCAVDAPLIWCP